MKICQSKMILIIVLLSGITLLAGGCAATQAKEISGDTDLTEVMQQSLVYLQVTNSGYDQYQPWKQTQVSKGGGFGCAVGPYEILTTAENVADATLVQIRCYAQNEWLPATVKVIDYEMNLALLSLDEDAIKTPLSPIEFVDSYPKGDELTTYWLSSGSKITKARSTLDRAEMRYSGTSFARMLVYRATNISRSFGDGEVCFGRDQAIGLACWGNDTDATLIPADAINNFLSHSEESVYKGFGQVGFHVFPLLDPTMRRFLKMPPEMDYGAYISTVYSLGTGSDELKTGDVLLSIDGKTLNPYGRYMDERYDRISFQNLILHKTDGERLSFELWRDGRVQTVEVTAKNFKAEQMLVPYYMYGKQPEYVVLGGFVFQTLTRDYLKLWGDGWSGKVPPHLYHYYNDLSFKPMDDREEIVLLNYVLPTDSNLGYQQLSRLIVSTVDGKKVKSIKDILDASTSSDNDFVVVEFEMDSPKLVIKKADLAMENMKVAQMYGIPKLHYIEPSE